ncbi:MAG: DUF4838 domain-containing protein [Verrucomicrobiota bacterium]
MCRALTFTLALLLGTCFAQADRRDAWLGGRVLGSSQLRLEELRVIKLPRSGSETLRLAAEDLKRLLSDRCGAAVVIQSDRSDAKRSVILELVATPKPIRAHGGFTISRERTQIYIRAITEDGLINGIYTFCSDILGARWYWDGPLGFQWVGEIPSHFPEQVWRERPAFAHRQLHPVDSDYGRRNRLNSIYRFNHNLANVFTQELFEQEPEVFPAIRGALRIPKGSGSRDAQPQFANPRTVEVAADAVINYFKENPTTPSFSLSINDNVLFDDTAATEEMVSPLSYFRRRPNYTDLVFRFMNAVAVQVFDQAGMWTTIDGQSRYLTALAYYWTEQSPSFEIHPRVMPVLTSDRAQWHDPDYRADDIALIDRWANCGAERIATWDYYFGAPYPYPRQFNQWISESLAILEQAGVDTFFSQAPAFWGLDGPKSWLASQLLWNPKKDAEALLDEYYTNFFGLGANSIRQFYEIAEQHRNKNEGEADWIKFYKDEAGIELFDTDTLQVMRAKIEEAVELVAENTKYAARLTVVSDAFAFTEQYAVFHQARKEMVDASLDILAGSNPNSGFLEEKVESYQVLRKSYLSLAARLLEDPLHVKLRAFLDVRQSDPLRLAEGARQSISDLRLDQFQPVFDNVDLRNGPLPPRPRDFLGPDLPDISGWNFDFRASEFLTVQSAETVKLNERGISVSGADIFSIFRDVSIQGGLRYYLDVDASWKVSPDNRTQIRVNWYDAEGKTVLVDVPLQLPNGASRESQRILLALNAPSGAVRARIHFTTSRQYPGDFLALTRVDLRQSD